MLWLNDDIGIPSDGYVRNPGLSFCMWVHRIHHSESNFVLTIQHDPRLASLRAPPRAEDSYIAVAIENTTTSTSKL